MTQALVLRPEPAALAPAAPAGLAPRSIGEVAMVAEKVARSGLYGVKNADDAFVRIMTGMELGLSALQALRGVYVINGRPTLAADMMVGVCKRATDLCRHFRLVESTEQQATYETERIGEGVTSMTYTIAQARNAGLAHKDTWKGHAPAMLRARASSLLARAVYSDLLNGLYTQDEAEDIAPRPGPALVVSPPHDPVTGEVPALPVPAPTPRETWDAGPPRDADALRAELLALAPKLGGEKAVTWLNERIVTCKGNAGALEALLERVEARIAERAMAAAATEPTPAPPPVEPTAPPTAVDPALVAEASTLRAALRLELFDVPVDALVAMPALQRHAITAWLSVHGAPPGFLSPYVVTRRATPALYDEITKERAATKVAAKGAPTASATLRATLEARIGAATTEAEADAALNEATQAFEADANVLTKIDMGALRAAHKRQVVALQAAAKDNDEAESAALRTTYLDRIAAAPDDTTINRVIIEKNERFEAGILTKTDAEAVKAAAEKRRARLSQERHSGSGREEQ